MRSSRRNLNTFPNSSLTTSSASAAAAAASVNTTSEQQFLEHTPWANPNHPIHRLGRQTANRSPLTDGASSTIYNTSTPANQRKRAEYTPQAIGSASTIIENPSAQPSSAINTPHDSAIKQEPQTNGLPTTSGLGASVSRQNSISPTETRRTINSMLQASTAAAAASEQNLLATTSGEGGGGSVSHLFGGVNSSPLQARAALLTSLNRTASVQPADRENTRSPFRQGLVSGGGMGRFGFR